MAVDDGLVRRNPCRIKGGGVERSQERPVLTPRQVFDLADAIDQRYRALVLLAVFCSLRRGEVVALQRADIDLEAGTVFISRQQTEVPGHGLTIGPPKSAAGKRVVAMPDVVIPVIREHLSRFTCPDTTALVFTSPTGKSLRYSGFRQRVWCKALQMAGLSGIHFHDLRHTGNNLAAATGASLRELMDRMGHRTTRAAMIYLHGSDARQREIADMLGQLTMRALEPDAESAPGGTDQRQSGTQRARRSNRTS
ncbi:MAG: tyrosine-type recombinase/integrase [Micromonosporaceae bacterium]